MAQNAYIHVNHAHLNMQLKGSNLLLNYRCLKWLLQWINDLYSTSLNLLSSFDDAYECLVHTH